MDFETLDTVFGRQALGGTQGLDPAASIESRQRRRTGDASAFFPGALSDRVTISEEAKAAWAAMHGDHEAAARPETEKDGPLSASDAFSAFMTAKRSKAQGGSDADRVEQLQNKLRSLQSRLSRLTSGKELPGGGNAEAQVLQAQISATMAELAEALKADL